MKRQSGVGWTYHVETIIRGKPDADEASVSVSPAAGVYMTRHALSEGDLQIVFGTFVLSGKMHPVYCNVDERITRYMPCEIDGMPETFTCTFEGSSLDILHGPRISQIEFKK